MKKIEKEQRQLMASDVEKIEELESQARSVEKKIKSNIDNNNNQGCKKLYSIVFNVLQYRREFPTLESCCKEYNKNKKPSDQIKILSLKNKLQKCKLLREYQHIYERVYRANKAKEQVRKIINLQLETGESVEQICKQKGVVISRSAYYKHLSFYKDLHEEHCAAVTHKAENRYHKYMDDAYDLVNDLKTGKTKLEKHELHGLVTLLKNSKDQTLSYLKLCKPHKYNEKFILDKYKIDDKSKENLHFSITVDGVKSNISREDD